jgi:hypothetical protein
MKRTVAKTQKNVRRVKDVQRQSRGPSRTAHSMKGVQSVIGNHAAQRLLRSPYVQGKLQTSEADNKGSEEVNRKPGMESQIERLRGGGQPLPESLRAQFEPRFGQDFSDVRLHTGSDAAEAAQNIGAKAFTVGNDVAFGAAQYSPETGAGKTLLAHELTHVVQQKAGTTGPTIQRQPGTDYGLATAASQNKYVAEAVKLWTTKQTMKIEDFVNALMNVIKTDLLSQGVPEFKWQMDSKLGVSGEFDSEHWIVSINPSQFSSRKVKITQVKDLTLDEVQEVVATLYHESRHTDQDLLIIRVLLDQKKTVKEINQQTKIPERIVEKVKATKFKTPPDTAQAAHATRMFAVMYGQHKELLEFLMKNKQLVDVVQGLSGASSANDLKVAAPHVAKLADWQKNVLGPKLKQLAGAKTGGPMEAQLQQDLGALDQETAKLLVAFNAAVKIKNPTDADLEDLRNHTDDWQNALIAAYKNLEGEKDAFAVEESVKKAFKQGATAKPAPPPPPPKKKSP